MTQSVLIVDDEYGLAEMVGLMLGLRGFDTHIAINGDAGLTLARTHPFHLILTDVMMPLMDGIEMIRHIRATPDGARIPIVVMTAMPTGLTPEERALAQGLLIKPFSRERLFEVIDSVLTPGLRAAR